MARIQTTPHRKPHLQVNAISNRGGKTSASFPQSMKRHNMVITLLLLLLPLLLSFPSRGARLLDKALLIAVMFPVMRLFVLLDKVFVSGVAISCYVWPVTTTTTLQVWLSVRSAVTVGPSLRMYIDTGLCAQTSRSHDRTASRIRTDLYRIKTARHFRRPTAPEHHLRERRHLACRRQRQKLYLRLCPHSRGKMWCILKGKRCVKICLGLRIWDGGADF